MRQRDFDVEDPLAWARRLVETKDIDPIYEMLVGAYQKEDDFESDQLARWLVAYWCFYHAGSASLLSEHKGDKFWDMMHVAAANIFHSPKGERWPRSSERRYFRGPKCVAAVQHMEDLWPQPEALVIWFAKGTGDAPQIMELVKSLPLFGPWIAFKVADMLERVWGRELFFGYDVAFYDSPRKGAEEMATIVGGDWTSVLAELEKATLGLPPPGLPSRAIGVQEYETICCKWHSARSGHYFIGKDLLEVRHALDGWGVTATMLRKYVPSPTARIVA